MGSSSSFSSLLSYGNFNLLDVSGNTPQVPQAAVEPADYGSVIWPDSLSE